MAKLVGLQFKFQYRKGVDNGAADALSRVGHLMSVNAMSLVQSNWVQEVTNSYETDAEAQELLQQLALHSPDEKGFSLQHGLIRFKGRIWIGANSALRTKLISALHDSAIGGHSGTTATYQRLKKLFAWTGLKAAVEEYVHQCQVCQQSKHEHIKIPGKLQPLPIQKHHGKISRWTLWRGYPNLRVMIPYWWWSIVSLSYLTLYLCAILSQQHK